MKTLEFVFVRFRALTGRFHKLEKPMKFFFFFYSRSCSVDWMKKYEYWFSFYWRISLLWHFFALVFFFFLIPWNCLITWRFHETRVLSIVNVYTIATSSTTTSVLFALGLLGNIKACSLCAKFFVSTPFPSAGGSPLHSAPECFTKVLTLEARHGLFKLFVFHPCSRLFVLFDSFVSILPLFFLVFFAALACAFSLLLPGRAHSTLKPAFVCFFVCSRFTAASLSNRACALDPDIASLLQLVILCIFQIFLYIYMIMRKPRPSFSSHADHTTRNRHFPFTAPPNGCSARTTREYQKLSPRAMHSLRVSRSLQNFSTRFDNKKIHFICLKLDLQKGLLLVTDFLWRNEAFSVGLPNLLWTSIV